MFCFLSLALIGACGVVLAAELLRYSTRLSRWRIGTRLALAHTIIVVGFLALAPLYIRAIWGSPYGDIYAPFWLVPGYHIETAARSFLAASMFPWLLNFMESFPASVLCIIVAPGLVGIVVGGVQWWLIGATWERFALVYRV